MTMMGQFLVSNRWSNNEYVRVSAVISAIKMQRTIGNRAIVA